MYWSEQLTSPDRLGPIRFSGHLFGYESCIAEVWLPPVDDALGTVVVELMPTANAWANVEIQLVAPESELAPSHVTGGVGHLVLKHLDTGVLVTHVLESLRAGSILFEGVPEGDYHVYLTTKYGFYNSAETSAPILLRINRADPEPVRLDVSSLCSIVFDVRSEERIYTGAFAVEVQGKNEQGSAFAHFDGPPYSLEGLSPGDYRFTVYTPEFVPSDSWVRVGKSSDEGAASRVAIQLP